ncbi:MAG: tRNA pseudouridine(38-40) synthase TruA [Chloroflexota bacterium]|nr:tRNA pseudouridine(38-40) synthase TruA [Chloroflexota bacterium]
MIRYRGTLTYDGSAYQGFQRQANGVPTIQAEVERALGQVTGQTVTVLGAGRTDTGVHASGQVIAFDAIWRHEVERLLSAVNATLPFDIALIDLRVVSSEFHPRFDALSRTYRYVVLCAPTRDPLLLARAWHIAGMLDGERLHVAAALLVGTHDFGGFGTAPQPGAGTVRAVSRSEWVSAPHPAPPGTVWTYHVEANAFLKHMVRRIVGVLVAVGRGHKPIAYVRDRLQDAVLEGSLPAAPPQGLTLVNVRYHAGETPAEITGKRL